MKTSPPNCIRKPASLRARSSAGKKALALSIPALLASAPSLADDDEFVLDTMQIEDRTSDTNPYAEPGAPYKAKISGDQRRVVPIAETPQTLSVLTETAIKESGKSDLRALLVAQPGVTLGTGENGNAFGDRYIIRGHEARSDVFVDGLRDPGMTTRESFAVEQIEITKGPSATFAGRGSTGGAVNSITKQASTDYHFNKLEGALGSDAYRRVTLDSNVKLSEETALRFNLLHKYEEVPDRAPADRERNGIAASITNQTTEKLSLAGDVYFLDAKDSPDLGTYIVPNGDPVDDLPAYTQEQDFLDSQVQSFTFRLNYDFSESLRFHNATRYGTTENGYVVTGARGTNRAEDITDSETGEVTPGDPDAPGAATVSLSTHQGWQEVDYFVNQSNLFFNTEKHNMIFSLEYSDLGVMNGVYSVENTGESNCVTGGRRGNSAGYCIVDVNGNYITDNSNLMGRSVTRGGFDSDYNIKTWSLAAMDVFNISESWILHAGLRVDSFEYTNDVIGRGASEPTRYDYSDELFNGHLGLVYKINEQGNVYVSYGTATNINGGESDVGANCGYGGICTDAENVGAPSPETTSNVELGTKWNLREEKLLLAASVFQITKSDVMESLPSGSSYSDAGTINTGENEVSGFEVSLVGNISESLSTQLGLTMMESEITASNNADNIGQRLANFADDSAYAQLRWQASNKFVLGGTMSYSSELLTGQPDAAAGETYKVPSYTVFDLFASYEFNDKLRAQLNIGNITDEDYYLAAYRSGAFTYIGDARNAQAKVVWEF